MNAISRFVKKLAWQVAKKSPVICLVGGIACVAGGTVYAIAKSDKAHEVMDNFQREMDEIHKNEEIADKRQNPEQWYPQDKRKRHKKNCYGNMIKSMAKVYLPVVILELLGIVLIVGSHVMLTKQIAGLSASLATVTGQFNTYRKRVEEKYGKEAEQAIFYGFEDSETTETVLKEDGTSETQTTQTRTANPCSRWARFLDETSAIWEKNSLYTRDNLRVKQSVVQRLLVKYGFLTMNDIYKELDLELDPELGNDWGIVYDKTKEQQIDFYNKLFLVDNSEATRRFVNGQEKVLLMDFEPVNLKEAFAEKKGERLGLPRFAPARL